MMIATEDVAAVLVALGALRLDGSDRRFARALTYIDLGPGNCWTWMGTRNRGGYGRIRDGGKVVAHRFLYERLVGPIPVGMDLDHLCRNRACVNPAHLEPVTPQENNRRGESLSARHARQTHCIYGHPLTEENTYANARKKFGMRQCKTCTVRRGREQRAAKRTVPA